MLNAMMYFRGNSKDYDEWESFGNLGWGLTPTILGCNHNEYKFHDAATAKIRHCGDYFVYYLTQERRSYISRYCTE